MSDKSFSLVCCRFLSCRRNLLNVLDFLKKPNASELVSGTKDRVNLHDKFRTAIEAAFPGTIDQLAAVAREKMLAQQKKQSFWESATDANSGGFKFSFWSSLQNMKENWKLLLPVSSNLQIFWVATEIAICSSTFFTIDSSIRNTEDEEFEFSFSSMWPLVSSKLHRSGHWCECRRCRELSFWSKQEEIWLLAFQICGCFKANYLSVVSTLSLILFNNYNFYWNLF